VAAADANESPRLTASCCAGKLVVNIRQHTYQRDHKYAEEAPTPISWICRRGIPPGKTHNSPAADLSCSPQFDFAFCIPLPNSTPRIFTFFRYAAWRMAKCEFIGIRTRPSAVK